MSNKEFKVKEFKGKIKDKEGKKDKYEIVKFKEKENKIKLDDKGEKGEATIKVMLKQANSEGKFEGDTSKEKEGEITVEYAQGKFMHYGKITKVNTDTEIETTKEVGLAGFSSFRYTFWISISVFAVLVVGLIWYFIASRRKEDKEEESL